MTLQMWTSSSGESPSSRSIPSRYCPARPPRGLPSASSSAPGASPTRQMAASGLPRAKTVRWRVLASGHAVQPATRRSTRRRRARGSRVAAPWLPLLVVEALARDVLDDVEGMPPARAARLLVLFSILERRIGRAATEKGSAGVDRVPDRLRRAASAFLGAGGELLDRHREGSLLGGLGRCMLRSSSKSEHVCRSSPRSAMRSASSFLERRARKRSAIVSERLGSEAHSGSTNALQSQGKWMHVPGGSVHHPRSLDGG